MSNRRHRIEIWVYGMICMSMIGLVIAAGLSNTLVNDLGFPRRLADNVQGATTALWMVWSVYIVWLETLRPPRSHTTTSADSSGIIWF